MLGLGNNLARGGVLSAGLANTYSLEFDGTDDYVNCGTGLGTSLGDNYAGSLSVSLWFKVDDTNVDDGLFQLGTLDGNGAPFMIFLVSNELKFMLDYQASAWSIVHSFTDTGWNHLVCIYDVSGSANSKMYLNGTSVGAINNDGNFPDGAGGDMDLSGEGTIIGAYWSVAYPFAGNIDEVAIFDAVIDPADLRDGTKPADLTGMSNLQGWWRMGDGTEGASGNTIYDMSTNSNDGTKSGASGTNNTPQYETDVPS